MCIECSFSCFMFHVISYLQMAYPDSAASAHDYNNSYYYVNYTDYNADYDMYTEDMISDGIDTYAPIIMIGAAILFNLLTFIVMTKLYHNVTSVSMYYLCLTMCDTILIIVRCSNVWLSQVWYYNMSSEILSKSESMCQLYNFISSLLRYMCTWLVVGAACESTISLYTISTLNLEKTKHIILLILLFSVCINVSVFWSYGLEPDFYLPEVSHCTFSSHGNYYNNNLFRDYLWPITTLTITGFIPQIVIGCCCGFYSRRLCSSVTPAFQSKTSRAIYHTIYTQCRTAFVIGLLYMICMLPELLYNSFEYIAEQLSTEHQTPLQTMKAIALRRMVRTLSGAATDIYLCSKFVVYLTTWPSFRYKCALCFRSVSATLCYKL